MEVPMLTQEIPMDEWRPFFDNLSRNHQNEPITIEIDGADLGAQPAASGVKLIGITFDAKEDVAVEIDVLVRNQADAHLMHAIPHPSHVRIARTEDGFDSALQLESDNGPTTLVRFGEQQPIH